MADTEINLHRDIGHLQGRLQSLEHQMAEHRTGMTLALSEIKADMKASMGELKASLDAINQHIQAGDLTDAQRMGAVKGAWWVIGLVSASLITLGGLLAAVLRSVLK